MIASDRVRLDGLIRQLDGLGVEMGDDGAWECNNANRPIGQRLLTYANELHRIQNELAALLVLGDARPQEEAAADDLFERHSCGCVFDKREPMRGYVCPEHFSTFGPPKP